MTTARSPRNIVWAFLSFNTVAYTNDLRRATAYGLEVIVVEVSHVEQNLSVIRLGSSPQEDCVLATIFAAELDVQVQAFFAVATTHSGSDEATSRILLIATHGQSGTFFLRRQIADLHRRVKGKVTDRELLEHGVTPEDFQDLAELVLHDSSKIEDGRIDVHGVRRILHAYGLQKDTLPPDQKENRYRQLWEESWGEEVDNTGHSLGGLTHLSTGRAFRGPQETDKAKSGSTYDLSVRRLRELLGELDTRIDLVVLACCSLGTVEVAYELREVCSLLMATPSLLYRSIEFQKPMESLSALPEFRTASRFERCCMLAREIIRAEDRDRAEIEVRAQFDCLKSGAALVVVDNESSRFGRSGWDEYLAAFDRFCRQLEQEMSNTAYSRAMGLMANFHDMANDASLMMSQCNCSNDENRLFFTFSRDLIATGHAIQFCIDSDAAAYQSRGLADFCKANRSLLRFFTANARPSLGCRSHGLGVFAPSSRDRLYPEYNGVDAGGLFEFLNDDGTGFRRWRSILEKGLESAKAGDVQQKGHEEA